MTGLGAPLRASVGDATAKVLTDTLGLRTVGDLLEHYPRRYEERGALTDLNQLRVGDEVTVLGQVRRSHTRPMRNRPGWIQEVEVGDPGASGQPLRLTFFSRKRMGWREKELAVGRIALFAGKVDVYGKQRQLVQPAYQLLDERGQSEGAVDPATFAGTLIPVYAATAKLPSWRIAVAVKTVLDVLELDDDPLPAALRTAHRLPGLLEALRGVHRPADRSHVASARERLKWDEALRLQVALAQRRAGVQHAPAVPRPPRAGGLLEAFDAGLAFTLTDGQRAVGEQLVTDLSQPHPMHRLLSGEVGSGKTVVALRAMLAVLDAGGQCALLAPTEVLATQHLRSLRDLLGPLGRAGELDAADEATRVTLLTGSLGAAARREALAAAADGTAGIVIGTHALLSEGVVFADLGLVVIDEQHRFGVEQRDALRSRAGVGIAPHVLVMTATPIPRTVAMTVFGDLELSALTELPAGRQPIATHVVDKPHWQARMWDKVREEAASGRQAYVVCPRIEVSDADAPDDEQPERRPAAAVSQVLPMLAAGELAGLRLAALHGRLPTEEKDAVMRQFTAGTVDVLVATTVIEVGVDVANATVMVVLDADRFGVSQLHQLRGRIGRGAHAATCLLHTDLPPESPAALRLAAVASTNDGAALARLDLEQRREGDVLGAAQSGSHRRLKLLRLLADEPIITQARAAAQQLVEDSPDLAGYPALAASVAAMLEDASYLEKG